MTYAITNLHEVEDEAEGFGLGEIQESRFPRRALGAESTGLAHHRLKPGQRTPFAHRHEQAEEVHLVLGGAGTAILDGEEVPLRAFDLLRLSPGVLRTFEAGPEGLEYVVFGPHHEGDGEVVRD